MGPAASLLPWIPEPGAHTLSLVDFRNQVLDSVEFTVRGRN